MADNENVKVTIKDKEDQNPENKDLTNENNELNTESNDAAVSNNVATSNENEKEDGERNRRKVRIGIVYSNKMDKTATVTVENFVRHKLYNKAVKRTKRFKVHDEKNECQIGDKVKIMETRPLSKDKRFRLVEIIEKVK